MPLYDVECEECGYEREVFRSISQMNEVFCPKCGGSCRTLITCSRSKDWFQPHWNPNFDLDPTWVRSRSHYKDLCRKHDVTSKAFGDIRNRKC